MPIQNFTLTRRQTLLALTATGIAPLTGSVFAQAPNRMRGALIILSTPYTDTGEVDYEDLANEVAFLDRCGVHGLVWPQNCAVSKSLPTPTAGGIWFWYWESRLRIRKACWNMRDSPKPWNPMA